MTPTIFVIFAVFRGLRSEALVFSGWNANSSFSPFSPKRPLFSASPKPHPSKPRPCNLPQAKTEVALQFSECCAAETALQHWLFCSAKSHLDQKLRCNKRKTALQHRKSCVAGKWRFPAAFLRVSSPHVWAPTFRTC